MALAIDCTFMSGFLPQWLNAHMDSRYRAYRASAHATVVKDSSLLRRLGYATGDDLATREALEWQADQDEDLDEAEVIHHLYQQAKSSPVFGNAFPRTERSDAITTLVTSCSIPSQSFLASAQGRPLSSFRRLSIRQSMFACTSGFFDASASNLDVIDPNDKTGWVNLLAPAILGEGRSALSPIKCCVLWHVQWDLVDLLSPRTRPTWRPGKRRRTTINPFHQVPAPPEQDASPGNHPPEAKRFKGVRYRRERKTWAAEMKPSKYKNKVSFGEFMSQAQAARAIDAAFHYYGKPHFLNFPDTPRILATRPSPAGVLSEEDQLRFVKEQVKWLASMASTLPSSPPLALLEIPESSSRGCIGDTLGFRTFSEISSFLGRGVADESDDGTSHPLPSLHPDILAEFGGHGLMETHFVSTVSAGGIMGSLDEHEGMLAGSSEDALVVPSSLGRWSPSSSVQIADVVDESSAPAVTNLTNFADPSTESPGSWVNYLAMFPPAASMLPLPPRSPTSFHVDVTQGLLESESFGGGEWLRG